MNLSIEQQQKLLQAATRAKVAAAMAAIERAQQELGTAASLLSSLQYGHPAQRATSKLYDRVHAHWYRVQRLQHDRRVRLDPANTAAVLAGAAQLQGSLS